MDWIRRLSLLSLLLFYAVFLMGGLCNSDSETPTDPGSECEAFELAPDLTPPLVLLSTGANWQSVWDIDGEPAYSVSLVSGALPPGLGASIVGAQLSVMGAISEEGYWQSRLWISDDCPDGSQGKNLDLKFLAIAPGNCPAITLADYGPQLLALDHFITVELDLDGGFGAYEASLVSGSLPPGLTLFGTLPNLRGTPTLAGTFDFRLRFEDDCPDASSARLFDLSLEVSADHCYPLIPGSLNKTVGAVGHRFSSALQVTGGNQPLSYQIVDPEQLPPGLAQSEQTPSFIAGTPTTSGDYSFTMRASDSCEQGPQAVEVFCSISILPGDATCEPLAVLGLAPSTVMAGADYLGTLVTSGGTAPLRAFWRAEALPAGLFVEHDALEITGRPLFPGSYTITGSLLDACPIGAQSLPYSVTLTVLAAGAGECLPLLYDDAELPLGLLNVPYSTTLQVSGGEAPLAWTLLGLNAPGLSFSNGSLSGTPTQTGDFTLDCYVYDACSPEPQVIHILKPITIGSGRVAAEGTP